MAYGKLDENDLKNAIVQTKEAISNAAKTF